MTKITDKNTIYIIGAGAIGKALAVVLRHNGKDAVLVRGSVDDGSTFHNEVSLELIGGKKYVQSITTITLNAIKRVEGIVVLTNKSFGNERLAARLTKINGKFPIVILQNGLGVESVFLNRGFNDVYRCVLFATSQVVGDNTVRFRTVSVSPIGVVKGNVRILKNIVNLISTPDFRFNSTTDIQTIVWKKTIMNTVFNSVCPLLEIDNGIFYRDKVVFEFARRIIKACVEIANTAGIEITVPEIEEGLLQISRSSDGQLISTLQDIKNGRCTEIETLNFEIAKIAGFLQMQELTREIAVLGELTKMKASIHQQQTDNLHGKSYNENNVNNRRKPRNRCRHCSSRRRKRVCNSR